MHWLTKLLCITPAGHQQPVQHVHATHPPGPFRVVNHHTLKSCIGDDQLLASCAAGVGLPELGAQHLVPCMDARHEVPQ